MMEASTKSCSSDQKSNSSNLGDLNTKQDTSNGTASPASIIQKNPSTYNLLTRPFSPISFWHVASGSDNSKLFKQRWMQCPNPSILSENIGNSFENGVDYGNGAHESFQDSHMDEGFGRSTSLPTAKSGSSFLSNYSQQQHHPDLSPQDITPQSPSVIHGSSHGRVNTWQLGTSGGAYGPSYGQSILHSRDSAFSSMPSSNRGESSNTGSGYLNQNQIVEMQMQLEAMQTENLKLRCQTDHLSKVKEHLMTRLGHAVTQCEAWKTYVEHKAMLYGNVDDRVGEEAFDNPPAPGSRYSPYMDDNFMMRDVGEMFDGSNESPNVGIWDGESENRLLREEGDEADFTQGGASSTGLEPI